jgi:uncharacterized protein (DUF488 family)
MNPNLIYTIGHSNQSLERFLEIISSLEIDLIADVRTAPASKMFPHFNRVELERNMKKHHINYVYLGEALGGRSDNLDDYYEGQIVYSKLAQKANYINGIRWLIENSNTSKIMLMCSEKEPLNCHRTLLISQSLTKNDAKVSHILSDGILESHEEALSRLLKLYKLDEPTLFSNEIDNLSEALQRQEKKVAYKLESMTLFSDRES